MTKAARAFRDLARREGGASPEGGGPTTARRATGRRPVSCPPRRATRGAASGRASAPPGEGCLARARKPQAPRRERQRPGGYGAEHRPRWRPRQVRPPRSPGGRLLEGSCGPGAPWRFSRIPLALAPWLFLRRVRRPTSVQIGRGVAGPGLGLRGRWKEGRRGRQGPGGTRQQRPRLGIWP